MTRAGRCSTMARVLALLTCVFFTFARPLQLSTQTAVTDPRFERIASVVREKMAVYGIPGVALGISSQGKRLTRGFGVTSVENPLPITETTLFQAGSITKTFTSTVVMRLVEAGKLKLDAPVRTYIPTFRVRDEEASRRATVRTLLTHMGGWEGDFFEDAGDGDQALAQVVGRMGTLEQVAPFATIWSYNNAGFLVAGRLIEIASGRTYEAAVADLLVQPLGLRQTFFFPAEVMTHRFAVGHAGPAARPIVLSPWPIPRALRPAGGVIASVADLLRYAEFHLGDGTAPDGSRLLAPESMRRLHETQVAQHGTDDEMALGWQVSRIGGKREIWHDGAAVGQQALLSLIPSERLALVVLTNSVRGERLHRDVRRAVAEQYLGTTVADPPILPAPAPELEEYVGRYSRPFMDVVVTRDGDRLMVQTIQKQGFPAPSSPVPPPPPPAPYALYQKDRLVGLGPVAGDRAEFLRCADGTVGWIRVRGRVAPRVE
jgi:CubicO group peptidase (beta-lactamase class C family)